MDAQVRSLAVIRSGEFFTIESFQSESVRWIAGQLGLQQGGRFRCRARGARLLVLEDADGRTIIVETETADFIRIVVRPDLAGRDTGE
jgi:hypothetical protein